MFCSYLSTYDLVANEVTIETHMLCSFMADWILGKVDRRETV